MLFIHVVAKKRFNNYFLKPQFISKERSTSKALMKQPPQRPTDKIQSPQLLISDI